MHIDCLRNFLETRASSQCGNIDLVPASWTKLGVHPDLLQVLWSDKALEVGGLRKGVVNCIPTLESTGGGDSIVMAAGLGTFILLRLSAAALAPSEISDRLYTRRLSRGKTFHLPASLRDECVIVSVSEFLHMLGMALHVIRTY